MKTTNKPLDVVSLIQCLAGELLADPALVFETIKEEEDLQRIIRSYRLGDFTYYEVLDAFNDYIQTETGESLSNRWAVADEVIGQRKGYKMGARVVFNIKQDEDNYICLYSHWGEMTALEDAGRAIAKARPRWGDDSYCARILVSQLIGDEWDSETGFGLWVSAEPCTDEAWVLIDLQAQTVTAVDGTHTFEGFVNYHSVAV